MFSSSRWEDEKKAHTDRNSHQPNAKISKTDENETGGMSKRTKKKKRKKSEEMLIF